ncbi:hypothetical protein [Parafannyhessea umbonata]|uniref:hypothetical protein n=1 Tax=Parafannyhessea umbonata TaxID=604330 RepID=UPI003D7BFA86
MPSTAAGQPRSALSSRSTPGSAARSAGGSASRNDTSSAGSDALTLESLQPAGLAHGSPGRGVGSELSVGASPHSRPWVATASPVEASQTVTPRAPGATSTRRRAQAGPAE